MSVKKDVYCTYMSVKKDVVKEVACHGGTSTFCNLPKFPS